MSAESKVDGAAEADSDGIYKQIIAGKALDPTNQTQAQLYKCVCPMSINTKYWELGNIVDAPSEPITWRNQSALVIARRWKESRGERGLTSE